jgi:hypothetical protein
MMAWERQGRIVDDIQKAVAEILDATDHARSLIARWNAIGTNFLDDYFQAGNPGASLSITKAELLAALSTLDAAQGWLDLGHGTNLNKVR